MLLESCSHIFAAQLGCSNTASSRIRNRAWGLDLKTANYPQRAIVSSEQKACVKREQDVELLPM